MAKTKKNPSTPIPVALDDQLLSGIDEVSSELSDTRSSIMRRAIRAGLPLVKSGGDVVRLSGAISDHVGELSKLYKRDRERLLIDAIERGIHSTQAHLLYQPRDDISPEAAEGMLQCSGDKEPLLREVQQAKIEKGGLQIQLADLMHHCEDARDRKETIERHANLARKKYGSWPPMWGKGVTTEELKRQISRMEKKPGISEKERLKWEEMKSSHGPEYAVRQIVTMQLTTESDVPSSEKKSAPKKKAVTKKLPVKRAAKRKKSK